MENQFKIIIQKALKKVLKTKIKIMVQEEQIKEFMLYLNMQILNQKKNKR